MKSKLNKDLNEQQLSEQTIYIPARNVDLRPLRASQESLKAFQLFGVLTFTLPSFLE